MTLLRLVRATPGPTRPTPRVVGVDGWAWRKGQRYGTVLVDLERPCPVDLLPERTAEVFAAWLIAHPGVEVIRRDRGGSSAEGGRQGAPQALQIADRFHLVKNAGDHLEQVVARHHTLLRQAAEAAQDTGQAPVPAGAGPESGAAASRVPPSPGPSAPPSPEGCPPPPAGRMTRGPNRSAVPGGWPAMSRCEPYGQRGWGFKRLGLAWGWHLPPCGASRVQRSSPSASDTPQVGGACSPTRPPSGGRGRSGKQNQRPCGRRSVPPGFTGPTVRVAP